MVQTEGQKKTAAIRAKLAQRNRESAQYRISVLEWREREGLESSEAWEEHMASAEILDSVQPAMCEEGCEAEPDGHCEHGCPSLLLAMGVV